MISPGASGRQTLAGPLRGDPPPELVLALRSIGRSAAEQVSARYAVLVASIPGDTATKAVTYGFPEDAEPSQWWALEETCELLDRPDVVRVDDLAQLRAEHGLPPLSCPLTAAIGSRIHLDEQLYGYLYVAREAGSDPFTGEDEAPVAAMAAAAAAAIENARLLSLEQRRQRWMEASLEMTRVMFSDAGQASDVAVRRIQEITGADFASLVRITGDGVVAIEAVAGADVGRYLGSSAPLQGLSAKVAATGLPVVSQRITEEPGFDPPLGVDTTMSHLGPAMYLPLAVAGEVVGLVVIGWRRGASLDHVAPAEVQLAQMVAGQVALALQQLQAREMVAMDRDRIAHDLDEKIAARLAAVDAHLADTLAMIDEPGARDRVSEAIHGVHDANQRLRAAITVLQRRSASERPHRDSDR
ncbi:GAF domain-containing protein [Actinopolymorpha pittospori]